MVEGNRVQVQARKDNREDRNVFERNRVQHQDGRVDSEDRNVVTSDLDFKLMPKEKNRIAIRKVSTVIQSLLPRRSNHHCSYG